MNPMENETNNLEHALRDALRREDAPPSFAEQVLARVAQQKAVQSPSRNSWSVFFTQPLVRWAAFAAITASLVVGFIHHREVIRERAEGESAKQRLMLALRIAGSKLQLARSKVNEINDGSPHPNQEEKE